jgi:hypothetical protein
MEADRSMTFFPPAPEVSISIGVDPPAGHLGIGSDGPRFETGDGGNNLKNRTRRILALDPFILEWRKGILHERFPLFRRDISRKGVRIKRGLAHHRQDPTAFRIHGDKGSCLFLESLFRNLLEVEVNRQGKVISREGLHASEVLDLPSQSIHFNLPASIHTSEIGLPLIFHSIFPYHRPHAIRRSLGLSQFILIHLSQVTNEMRSQRTMVIGPPGSHIHKEPREMDPTGLESGQFIPFNIRLDLHRAKGCSFFLSLEFLLNLFWIHIQHLSHFDQNFWILLQVFRNEIDFEGRTIKG